MSLGSGAVPGAAWQNPNGVDALGVVWASILPSPPRLRERRAYKLARIPHMPVLLPASDHQIAMISCLHALGWEGDAEAAGDQLRVAGQSLTGRLSSLGPLAYEDAVDLLHCLVPQLCALEKRGLGMPAVEPEDVAVLEGGYYLLAGLDRAWEADERGDLIRRAPPVARVGAQPGTLGGSCLAPELRGQVRLPVRCTRGATAYSVGALMREVLGLKETLAPLAGSPLYYFIGRTQRAEPAARRLFFI